MPPFYYAPGNVDRSGEIRGAGLANLGSTLGDAIVQAKQKHDEMKAYSQLAGVLGLDPKHTTKQQVQAALLKNEIIQAQQQRQQQQRAQALVPKILQMIQANQQPGMTVEKPGIELQPGTGRAVPAPSINALQLTPTAGQSRLDALIGAFNTPEGQDILKSPEALNTMNSLMRMTGGEGMTMVNGVPMIRQPNGNLTQLTKANLDALTGGGNTLGRMTTPNAAEKNLPPEIDDDEEWQQAKTTDGSLIPGLYYGVKDGKRTGKRWYDPQSPARTGSSGDFMSRFQKVLTGDQTPTAEPGEVNGPPIGAVVKGYKFLGGNPADEKNWERADE